MKISNIKNTFNKNILKKKNSSVSSITKKNIFFSKKLLKINILKNIKQKNNKLISKFSVYKNSLKIKKIW